MKLLVFNEDYGDEHNVPALCVMTEKEYDIWCNSPSGELNPNYEIEKKAKDDYEVANKEFWKMLERKGYTINGRGNTSKIPKNDLDTLQLEQEYRKLKYPNSPKRVFSNLHAYLGNGGDYFGESYNHIYLNGEFVEKGIVKVTDVSDEFAKVFDQNNLSDLSLCNIFENDISELEDEDS